ncbi:hypothetical protein H0H81_011694, partial [Sphagnurus paluster]
MSAPAVPAPGPTDEGSDGPASFDATIISKFCFLEAVPATVKNKKASSKKAQMTKELTFKFEETEANYYMFLNTLLATHNMEEYKARLGSTFVYRMQVPPAKVSEACDIENFAEFKKIVKRVIESKPSKLLVVTVYAAQVEKGAKKRSAADTPDDDDNDDDDDEI